MNNKNISNKGFTLIELVVVLIIIGVLVLLATPRFLKTIKLAKYTQIINDIRVTEDVSVAHMVKNMELPKNKGLVKKDDLIKQAKENKSYLKNGLIQLEDTEDKEVEVGSVKLVGEDDLKGFYLLDKELFVRRETRTRLKGDFLINRDGVSIYVDIKGYDWNIEEDDQDIEDPETKPEPGEPEEPEIPEEPEEPEEPESKYDGIFIFNSNAIKGVIPGREENFKDLIIDDGNRLIIPNELKDSNGNLQNVRSIDRRAFENQTHNQFMNIIDFTEATELESIEQSAFEDNKISQLIFGDSEKLTNIGDSAFKNNDISNTINFAALSNLSSLGNSSFMENRISEVDLSNNTFRISIKLLAFAEQKDTFVQTIKLNDGRGISLEEQRNKKPHIDIFGEFNPRDNSTSISESYNKSGGGTYRRNSRAGSWTKL